MRLGELKYISKRWTLILIFLSSPRRLRCVVVGAIAIPNDRVIEVSRGRYASFVKYSTIGISPQGLLPHYNALRYVLVCVLLLFR